MQSNRVNKEFKNDNNSGGFSNLLAAGVGAAVIGAVGYGIYSLFSGSAEAQPEAPHQYRYGQNRSREGSVLPCPICLDELKTDIKYLKCGHGFHDQCIGEWFQKEKICPCCRDRHTSF